MLDNLPDFGSVLPDIYTALAAACGFVLAFGRTLIDNLWSGLKRVGAPFKGVGLRLRLAWNARALYQSLDDVMWTILRSNASREPLRIAEADAVKLLERLDGQSRLLGDQRDAASLIRSAGKPKQRSPRRRKPTPAMPAETEAAAA
jgi:hypothetical protein